MLEIIVFAFVNLENNAPNYPGLHTYVLRKSTKKRRNVYGEVFVTEVGAMARNRKTAEVSAKI